MSEQTWSCEVTGPVDDLPPGSDLPMRMAVREAFKSVTGNDETRLSSGWGRHASDAGPQDVERLDVRRVVQAIENVAARHGIKKDPPMPLALARIYGYSTTPDDMDAQIAAEYSALAPAPSDGPG